MRETASQPGPRPAPPARRGRRRLLAALPLPLLAAGCGFKLRGAADLPFETFYASAPSASEFGGELRRAIRRNGGTIVERREEAQARFDLLGESQERDISALSTSGRPREFVLRLRLTWRLRDAAERDLIGATEMLLRRTINVLDNQGVANQDEEALLYREMRVDAVQQILRQMSTLKARP
jgi:LPS-assembly lipoprotein